MQTAKDCRSYITQISYVVVIAFGAFVVWQFFYHVLFMTVLRVQAPWFEHFASLLVETGGAALVTLIVVHTLARTSRQLADLDRQKEAFTSMLVHDLRQPLTALLAGLSTAVKDERLPKQTRDLLLLASAGGTELVRMVNDLLDIGRMEAGQLPIEKSIVAPAEFIEGGVQDVEQLANEKRQEITMHVPRDLPPLDADGWRLRRVVMNIVSNAIRYTPTGGHISVSAALQQDGRQLVVSISDDGIGIAKEQQRAIFEGFAAANAQGSSGRVSTGLGLRFCKMIVEAHGGEIWVESQGKNGSTFAFSLPLAA